MKLSTTIVAALACIATPTMAETESVFGRCVVKAPEVVAAVAEYCTKLGDKAVVPSKVVGEGHVSKWKGKTVKVSIQARTKGENGECRPPQWLPKHYCMQQFYQMCANGDKNGQRAAHWGRNGCQRWYIESPYHKQGGQGGSK